MKIDALRLENQLIREENAIHFETARNRDKLLRKLEDERDKLLKRYESLYQEHLFTLEDNEMLRQERLDDDDTVAPS